MSIVGIDFPEINEFLDQSVEIQGQSEIDDGAGGITTSWVTVGSAVDGKVLPLTGKEVYEMENINPEIKSKVFLRKGSTVDTTNRLYVDTSKYYDVLFVKNPVSANEFIIAYTKSMDK